MIIKKLSVVNFRNHKNTEMGLSSVTNVLVGKNAQGKTNLLEAIFLTCVGRGWRTNKDKDMINFDSDFACVRAVAQKKFGEIDVQIDIARVAKKSIKINGIPIQKMGELMGQINCVFFSPDELRLIKDAPADRRRFLDIDISQIDRAYFYALLRYNKILSQRNALLKSKSEDIERGLDVWDVQLSKVAAFIMRRRLLFVEGLKNNLCKIHNDLTGGEEKIELSYINITNTNSEVSISGDCSEVDIEKKIADEIALAREKDMRLRTTTVGPHRDDIRILVDGKDVRYFASQGQQRTVALSLKLSELEIFKERTGEMPVMLLDDVFSELDAGRQKRLIDALSVCQSVITATQFDSRVAGASVMEISKGKIVTRVTI